STRKWKDEQSGQDKYSTEVVIQGYNSSLTMLGGGGGSAISNDTAGQKITKNTNESAQSTQNDLDDEIPF
ncbi:MAG: single-stranded DNA-binding protein, partial [Pelagibacterales bacterium]|nr:single-stranded DNA-binding protein [Pelagibacterales bacterium]